jgi:hypothetical protein
MVEPERMTHYRRPGSGLVEQFCDAIVGYLGDAGFRHEDVLGLEVPVRDPFRLREHYRVQERLAEPFPKVAPGERTLSGYDVLEIVGDPLHDEIPVAFRVPIDVDHLHDIGVPEALEHHDFALEALSCALVVRSEPNSLYGHHTAGDRVERLGNRRLGAPTRRGG